MDKTVAGVLASTLEAWENCRKNDKREWAYNHDDTLKTLCQVHLPSGSGFNIGTTFVRSSSSSTKLVFNAPFHHMDENGCYDGWTEHVVTVRPTFTGLDIKVSGKNRNDIKDYIHEVFNTALTKVIT
jgi:hypothetical protein